MAEQIFCDFYFWTADFFADVPAGFTHCCGKKCPEKSSMKIPGKILQNLRHKMPDTFLQQGPRQGYCYTCLAIGGVCRSCVDIMAGMASLLVTLRQFHVSSPGRVREQEHILGTINDTDAPVAQDKARKQNTPKHRIFRERLPKGPFRTKNTTALNSVVFYYCRSFLLSVAICCLISL